MSEPFGATFGVGQVYLRAGSAMSGEVAVSTLALLTFKGEAADAWTGNALAVGDWDGDGVEDYAVAAYAYGDINTTGRVYVALSGG